MNSFNYTGTTLFSMLMILVIIAMLLIIVINYIVKVRVARSVTDIRKANRVMHQAIDMSEYLIVQLDLKTNCFHNIHDERLPSDGESGIPLDAIRGMVHPDYVDDFDNFIQGLRYGEKQNDHLNYLFNTEYTPGKPSCYHWCNTNGVVENDSDGKPANIILTMIDETDELHIRQMSNDMADRYSNLFEDSIVGISFYNSDGYLIDCNRMMREICNFESRYDSLFYDTCIFDLAQFNINRDHVEESWLSLHLELAKRQLNKYLEARVVPINNAKGKLQYIALVVRDVTQERDLYMQIRQNEHDIRKASEEIQRYEEQLHYLLENSKMHVWRSSFEPEEIEFLSDLHHTVAKMSIDEFTTCLQTGEQERSRWRMMTPVDEKTKSGQIIMRPYKNLLVKDDKIHWYNFIGIPRYDDNGVQQGYFGLIRDVTQLIEEQEMLKQEMERASDSDRMKSVFLANMTHEIRTPLNSIVGFSDLLTVIDSPEEKREMMRIVRSNCDMLLRLINDFLAISSIESNGLSINPEECDFAREFDDFCQSLAQRVTEPSVQFITENPYTVFRTLLDKDRIGQVITNFVTNAVKYTTQGHIRVGYRVDNPQPLPKGGASGASETPLPSGGNGSGLLYVYCEDTGAGIPKEDCERVFERFVKLNDFIQGTGLGLSICKAIVEGCNGQIGVDSEVGKGSTFWFRIPCEVRELEARS